MMCWDRTKQHRGLPGVAMEVHFGTTPSEFYQHYPKIVLNLYQRRFNRNRLKALAVQRTRPFRPSAREIPPPRKKLMK